MPSTSLKTWFLIITKMNLKIQPLIRTIAGIAIMLSFLPNKMHGQETIKQTYTKISKRTYRPLTKQALLAVPDIEKVRLIGSSEKNQYTVYKATDGTINRVKVECLESSLVRHGLCKPVLNQYANSTIVDRCGKKDTVKFTDPSSLEAFEMLDKLNLFNFAINQAFYDTLNKYAINYRLLSDGTLTMWKNNWLKSYNKTTLVTKELGVINGIGPYQLKRLFKKFGTKTLLVLEEEDKLDTLPSGTVISVINLNTFIYPSTISNGKIVANDTAYNFPNDLERTVIHEHIATETEEEFMKNFFNPDNNCIKDGFISVYNILGQVQSQIKNYDEIKNAGLFKGVYIVKYKCNGSIKSKKIIID
jgi:hypothetical protein